MLPVAHWREWGTVYCKMIMNYNNYTIFITSITFLIIFYDPCASTSTGHSWFAQACWCESPGNESSKKSVTGPCFCVQGSASVTTKAGNDEKRCAFRQGNGWLRFNIYTQGNPETKLWRLSEDNNKQEDSQYESFNIIAAATSSTTTAYVTNLVHYGVIAGQVHSAFGRATGSCGGEVPQGGRVRSGILIFHCFHVNGYLWCQPNIWFSLCFSQTWSRKASVLPTSWLKNSGKRNDQTRYIQIIPDTRYRMISLDHSDFQNYVVDCHHGWTRLNDSRKTNSGKVTQGLRLAGAEALWSELLQLRQNCQDWTSRASLDLQIHPSIMDNPLDVWCLMFALLFLPCFFDPTVPPGSFEVQLQRAGRKKWLNCRMLQMRWKGEYCNGGCNVWIWMDLGQRVWIQSVG